jgi:hypothetical protein
MRIPMPFIVQMRVGIWYHGGEMVDNE